MRRQTETAAVEALYREALQEAAAETAGRKAARPLDVMLMLYIGALALIAWPVLHALGSILGLIIGSL